MQRCKASSSTSASQSRGQRSRSASRSVSKEDRQRRSRRKSKAKTEAIKLKSGTVSSPDWSSLSDETEGNNIARQKHMLKPLKSDGQTSFETFWSQFTNCAEHNQWMWAQKLAYLRSLLDKKAANVLWDYGKEVTDSLSSLTRTLKMRFWDKAFSDKHRIELRNGRPKREETLQSLYSNTRRLAALAFPVVEHQLREVIACDYFLDALADPGLALKIRERHPADLDSVLQLALQLDVRAADTAILREVMQGRTEPK